jgi:probable addiction module antidote protein
MAAGAKRSRPFDAARYLDDDDDEAVAEYITEALLTYDTDRITHAVAAKARGMGQTEDAAGLSRESLYKALSGEGNPQSETIMRVLTALGIRLRAEPADSQTQAA